MKLHLFGDSIFRGAVTDICDSREPALAELQSPAAIINLVARRPVARLAGGTHLPGQVQRGEAEIEAAFAAGRIAPGDAVAMLDVGPHAMDTARHEADWLRLRTAATRDHAVRLYMCGGFDNGGGGKPELRHEAAIDGRSPNDAVRAAALAPGVFAGTTRHVELAGTLRRLDEALQRRFGLTVYFHDGVHLTAWGQIGLSLLLLQAVGLPSPGLDDLALVVGQNSRRLSFLPRYRAIEALQATAAAVGLRSAALELRVGRSRVRRAAKRGLQALTGTRPDPLPEPDAEAKSLVERALTLSEAGAAEEALQLFQQAARRDRSYLAAHKGRVKAALRLERWSEVVAAGREVLVLDPSQGKYYVWVARAMVQERAGPELVRWLDQLAETHARRGAAQAMAELHQALGEPRRAAVWSARAAGRAPPSHAEQDARTST